MTVWAFLPGVSVQGHPVEGQSCWMEDFPKSQGTLCFIGEVVDVSFWFQEMFFPRTTLGRWATPQVSRRCATDCIVGHIVSVLAANAEKMEKHLPRLWALLPLKELLVAFCINTMGQEEAAPKTGVTGDEPVATELQTALTCFDQKSGERLEFCSRCHVVRCQTFRLMREMWRPESSAWKQKETVEGMTRYDKRSSWEGTVAYGQSKVFWFDYVDKAGAPGTTGGAVESLWKDHFCVLFYFVSFEGLSNWNQETLNFLDFRESEPLSVPNSSFRSATTSCSAKTREMAKCSPPRSEVGCSYERAVSFFQVECSQLTRTHEKGSGNV